MSHITIGDTGDVYAIGLNVPFKGKMYVREGITSTNPEGSGWSEHPTGGKTDWLSVSAGDKNDLAAVDTAH